MMIIILLSTLAHLIKVCYVAINKNLLPLLTALRLAIALKVCLSNYNLGLFERTAFRSFFLLAFSYKKKFDSSIINY